MVETFMEAVYASFLPSEEPIVLRAGFEARITAALARAIRAAPDSIDEHLAVLVAVERTLADRPAAAAWTAFVDRLVAAWDRAQRRADRRAARAVVDTRRRLALELESKPIPPRRGDVKAGPLARFVLGASTKEARS